MRSISKDNRGSIGLVVALIVTVVALVIGVYVLATFQTAMPNITNPTANSTATNIFTASWNAFGLAVVVPLIVVAGAIIGYIIRGFSGGRQ
ncbi:MAG: hypothetical protein NWE99_05345 [Candidatus Bathyarchaeota archaeon]|nr:hypothetical protein [Candidatus Bathyarchaeota archaeon]